MAGTTRLTEVFDLEGNVGGNVTTFTSNMDSKLSVLAINEHGNEDHGALWYVDSTAAEQLAIQFMQVAMDLKVQEGRAS
jgi:hypothetical protein